MRLHWDCFCPAGDCDCEALPGGSSLVKLVSCLHSEKATF